MKKGELSRSDLQVLAQVFDPESNLSKSEVLIDLDAPSDPSIPDTIFQALRRRGRIVAESVERYELANEGSKDDVYRIALSALDNIIDEYPGFASARNDRAQLRRWYYGELSLDHTPIAGVWRHNNATVDSIDDLQACIQNCDFSSTHGKISPFQCRLLGKAHTQLAVIYHATSKRLGEKQSLISCDFENLEDQYRTREDIEEVASKHFHLGGLYGNEIAKALAVHTNPHAKLCGSIVREAMKSESSLVA